MVSHWIGEEHYKIESICAAPRACRYSERTMRLLVFLLVCLAAPAQPARTLAALRSQAVEAREQNRTQDAVRLYRECVRLQPTWAEGWWYLGSLLYDQNAYAPAREALATLVQLEPQSPPAAFVQVMVAGTVRSSSVSQCSET